MTIFLAMTKSALSYGLMTSSRSVRNNEWTWFILGLGQSFVYDHVRSNQIKIRVREK